MVYPQGLYKAVFLCNLYLSLWYIEIAVLECDSQPWRCTNCTGETECLTKDRRHTFVGDRPKSHTQSSPAHIYVAYVASKSSAPCLF